jgi:uncharacterized protein
MFEGTTLFLLPLIGFVTGVIVGLTGVGGGSLMTPALIGIVGVPPVIAVGTDLLFAAITKSFGGWSHWRSGHVVKPLFWRLVLSSVAGAACFFAWMFFVKPDVTQLNKTIRVSLGIAVFITAIALIARPWLLKWRMRFARAHPSESAAPAVFATLVLGFIIGALVAVSSIGAGAIGVTALMLLFPLLPLKQIVGTDVAYAVPLTFLAGAAHASFGNLHVSLLIALLIGSIPGILLGAKICVRVPEFATRGLLIVMLTLAGWKLTH